MNAAQHILIFGVRCYRWVLSPAKIFLFGPMGHCRFTLSCSGYALEALYRHGALAGSWLALRRIGRCHPWGGCGADPVPRAKGEGQRLESKLRSLRLRTRSLVPTLPLEFRVSPLRDRTHAESR